MMQMHPDLQPLMNRTHLKKTCDVWFILSLRRFVNLFRVDRRSLFFNLTQFSKFLSSPVLDKKKEKEKAVTNSYQTFYISFYSWGLQAAVCLMSRMKVVKVSVCIYYFWSLSDCIRVNWLHALCICTGWMRLNASHVYLCKLNEFTLSVCSA